MVRTLLRELKEYKLPSLITPLFMVGEVFMEMMLPLMIAKIVDEGINKGDMNAILRYGVFMLIYALAGLLLGMGGGYFGAKAATGFARNLRKAAFLNIQTFSFKNIDRFSTSGLITRLTTDITNIQNAYQMILRMLVRAPISLIWAMILSFRISPDIARIYLTAVIILACILAVMMATTTGFFKQVFKRYDDLNESIEENIAGIRVVKTYVREDYENSKFRTAAENVYRLFVKAEGRLVMVMPILQLIIYSCIMLISWRGAHLIVDAGTLTTGELMSLLTYCMNILISLMMMAMVFVMIVMSSASGTRVAEVLNEKSDITDPEEPVREMSDGSVEFRHVDFAYSEDAGEKVLKDVSFSIASGETIGIIGGTGSAKTTLINLISRLYDAGSGEVLVGGRNVKEYALDFLNRKVSVVLQKNELFSGTVAENLRWGKEDASYEECKEAAVMACADEFIQKMPEGYDTYIERGGTNVSGGQKQRLCIARALLKDPKILIMDDSTSAVDTATDAQIRAHMKEAMPGVTKIIIAQRISSVEDADRVMVLDEGRVNGFGTPEELLENNLIYREVYETQKSGIGDFDQMPAGEVG